MPVVTWKREYKRGKDLSYQISLRKPQIPVMHEENKVHYQIGSAAELRRRQRSSRLVGIEWIVRPADESNFSPLVRVSDTLLHPK